jgi:elongation factor G
MAKLDLTRLRNIGVIAHIDAGKTTTTEHLLYYSGAVHKLGGVDEGNTTTDWMTLEQEKGITIQSACIPFKWKESLEQQTYTINLIDTPGHVDFTAEVERSLRVLDGAVVVFDAQKGVEAQSETVWRQADKYNVPRIIFINKMDIVGADFANALEQIKVRLKGLRDPKPVPVTIPIGAGSVKDSTTPFSGVIDLLTMEAVYFEPSAPGRPDGKTVRRTPVPDDLRNDALRWREKLFDAVTEDDPEDKVTSTILAGEEPAPAALNELLRRRTLRGDIQPVFAGSGREHIGVQLLLNGICWYLPGPLDRPPVTGRNPKKNKDETRKCDPSEPLAALVFKIQADPHGELYYLRIYSGTLKSSSRPFNPIKQVKEFVTKIFHVKADPTDKEALDESSAGDIVAVVGPKESITGDTLCDPNNPILLESIQFAPSVVSMSIEPESSADRAKMEQTLTTLAREDPTFRWLTSADTGQTLISGMGVLHLEIKTHRLREDFRLKVKVGKPIVSYRETMRRSAVFEGEGNRLAGTSGLFAKVRVRFEPIPWARDQGQKELGREFGKNMVETTFQSETFPEPYLSAAQQGVKDALQSGETGSPVINVRAIIEHAEFDEQLSNEAAFQAAGADAVHQAMRSNFVLLEPVMHLEVSVPEEYFGPISADLNARRGEIQETHVRGNLRIIEALVPMEKLFDYSDKVRSLSQGRASATMEPHSYRPAPDEALKKFFPD